MKTTPATQNDALARLDAGQSNLADPHQRAEVYWKTEAGVDVQAVASVISTTPFGIRIVLRDADDARPSCGQSLRIRLISSVGESELDCVVVASQERATLLPTITCRVVRRSDASVDLIERRRGPRWRCSDDFRPTGIAANPYLSNDFIQFRVVDASSDGIGAFTSIRNKFLGRGTILESILSFPSVGRISVNLAVRSVRVVSLERSDYLFLGLEFNALKKRERNILGQYLLQFSDSHTTDALRTSGLFPQDARRDIEWTFVTDETSYREALNLRFAAYSVEGKVQRGCQVDRVSDAFDARSRILICRKDGRAIATARLYFPEYGDRTEHEQFVAWPSELPRREDIVEVTRTCTHPDYRGANVFFSLLRFIVITATQAQRSWVVTSATPDLVNFYDWIGLKSTDITFNHPELNDLPHRLLIGNITDALAGRTVGAAAWHAVWKDALHLLNHDVSEGSLDRIRIFFFRILGPFAELATRVVNRR